MGSLKQYREFWIKTDELGLAQAFCYENYVDLKKLLPSEPKGLSETAGVTVRDGKISFFQILEEEQRINEKFEALISIARKYR